jgi:predicted transposase/invertase (TIGR01784 family)
MNYIMNTKRLNPLNDYLFLKYMGEKGDEEQLLAFLNAVLQRTGKGNMKSVEIIENKMLSADIIGDKASILDLRSVAADGTRINIEVQLSNLGNMDKRGVFYWCLEYAKGIEAGQDYQLLPNVIAINIVDYEFLPRAGFHKSFHLWEDEDRDCMLTDALEIHFVDMVKFRRLMEKDVTNNPLHRWLTFFDKNANKKTIKEILQMDTAIQKAQEKITFVSQDKESLRAYEMREMALIDLNSGMNFAKREGIAIGEQRGKREGITIGEQRGKREGKIEVAQSMKKAGMPINQICVITGLTEDEINS